MTTYRTTLRPATHATLPEGLKWSFVEAPYYALRGDLPRSKHPYGVFKTERPLTPAELDRFDIIEVDASLKIETGKSYKTRRGSRVEVIAVLDKPAEGGDTIIGLRYSRDPNEPPEITTWSPGGEFYPKKGESMLDIVGAWD